MNQVKYINIIQICIWKTVLFINKVQSDITKQLHQRNENKVIITTQKTFCFSYRSTNGMVGNTVFHGSISAIIKRALILILNCNITNWQMGGTFIGSWKNWKIQFIIALFLHKTVFITILNKLNLMLQMISQNYDYKQKVNFRYYQQNYITTWPSSQSLCFQSG